MATARRLPSGNYRVRIYLGQDEHDKPIYKSFTGPDKKKIELEAAQYNVSRKEKKRSFLTVEEAVKNYIENKSNVLSPSTIRAYKSILKNNFEEIKSRKIEKLSADDVQRFIDSLSIDHSPKTVKNVHALLTAAIAESIPDARFFTKLPKPQKSTVVIPTKQEIQRLFEYLKKAHQEVYVAALIAAMLGLRRGEICALEWSDIRNHRLYVTKSLAMTDKNVWVIKPPKTVSGKRTIPLPEPLEKEILSLKKKDRADERIIHMTPNTLTDTFIDARNALGFHFRFHDLRHYNASIMLALKIPDTYAMQRMGHATPNMLKRVYQHIIEETKNAEDDKMNEYMSSLLN